MCGEWSRKDNIGPKDETVGACYKSASDFFLSCGCFELGERPDPHQTQVSEPLGSEAVFSVFTSQQYEVLVVLTPMTS